MARATQSNVVTAEQLLAHIQAQHVSAPASTESFGITNFLADVSAGTVDRFGKISGALAASKGNFTEHYKLERSVQEIRGQQRLKAAAAEAARRINAALAA